MSRTVGKCHFPLLKEILSQKRPLVIISKQLLIETACSPVCDCINHCVAIYGMTYIHWICNIYSPKEIHYLAKRQIKVFSGAGCEFFRCFFSICILSFDTRFEWVFSRQYAISHEESWFIGGWFQGCISYWTFHLKLGFSVGIIITGDRCIHSFWYCSVLLLIYPCRRCFIALGWISPKTYFVISRPPITYKHNWCTIIN